MTLWACMKCAKGKGDTVLDHEVITASADNAPIPSCRACSSTLTAITLHFSFYKKIRRHVRRLFEGVSA